MATKEIIIEAKNGYIVRQGRMGNTPVDNEFWAGLRSNTADSQEATVVTFNDWPEDAIGKRFESRNVFLYVYSDSGNCYVDALDRGSYAPFDGVEWSSLNLPSDPAIWNWEEQKGITNLFSNIPSPNNKDPRWVSSQITVEKSSEVEKWLKGIVFYGSEEPLQDAYGENNNYFSFTQKPYFKLNVFPVEYETTEMYPSGGYVDPEQNLSLTWKYQYKYGSTFEDNIIGEKPKILSASVFLRNKSTGEEKEYACLSPYNSVTIPSSDLKAGNYSWEVIATADKEATVFCTPVSFTTLTEIPVAVPVSPIEETVDGNASVEFKWQYLSGIGSAQTKIDIQTSTNLTSWDNLVTQETQNQIYTAQPGELPTGLIYWRIRAYDSAGNTGDWSDPVKIIVRAKVEKPVILLALNQSRPVIQWNSNGQISYHLEIYKNGSFVYGSGEVPKGEKAHQVTDYLENGSYVAKLRIRDGAMELSDWAYFDFTISVQTALTPSIQVASIPYGLQITPEGLGEKNYLLRDGVPIAKITGEYIDFSASAGKHTYVLRAVDASDNFTDSTPVSGEMIIRRGVALSLAKDPSIRIELWLRNGGNPIRSFLLNDTVTTHHAAGREYPVIDNYEFRDVQISLAFSMRNESDWDALKKMLDRKETILYRDQYGEKMYLSIPEREWERNRFSVDFSMSANVVDYAEKIRYDLPGVQS